MSREIAIRCAYKEMASVAGLKPHPRNAKKHPAEQIDAMAKIIAHQGWRAPIVVSSRSGYVVAGHGRLAAAECLGVVMVPVDYQEFGSEAEELEHLAADNKLSEMGEMDGEALRALLGAIEEVGGEAEMGGYSEGEIAELEGRAALEERAEERKAVAAGEVGVFVVVRFSAAEWAADYAALEAVVTEGYGLKGKVGKGVIWQMGREEFLKGMGV